MRKRWTIEVSVVKRWRIFLSHKLRREVFVSLSDEPTHADFSSSCGSCSRDGPDRRESPQPPGPVGFLMEPPKALKSGTLEPSVGVAGPVTTSKSLTRPPFPEGTSPETKTEPFGLRVVSVSCLVLTTRRASFGKEVAPDEAKLRAVHHTLYPTAKVFEAQMLPLWKRKQVTDSLPVCAA